MLALRTAAVWLALAISLIAQDVVFHSDVSLVRVDAQVVGRDNRAIVGLRVEDFELRENGRLQPIRNFAAESMPVDVLLLIDVSTSMKPHVQRMADALQRSLRGLGRDDRVGIMVFDRSTHVRLPFRSNRDEVESEFRRMLHQERFNGGTDITRGLLDAADYVQRSARADARRAIVILTDDETERNRDEAAVERALARADAVLSALIAPNAMRYRGQPGQYPRRGGSSGGPLGDIIYPRRGGSPGGYPGGGPYPGGGGPYPGGGPFPGAGQVGSRTQSAGTSEIARASGGDSMSVDDAGAFEDTLARLRQRYALHFLLPAGVRAGEQRQLDVSLSAAARRRYPDAEVRCRRSYIAGATSAPADPSVITQSPAPSRTRASADPDEPPRIRRRPAVDAVPAEEGPSTPAASPAPAPASPAPVLQKSEPDPQSTAPNRGAWRRLKPGEEP